MTNLPPVSRTLCLLAGLVLGAPATLLAQETPPCPGPAHREFDFWLGEWAVRDAAGDLAGYNSLRPVAAGCGISEEWRGSSGLVGNSMNYVDPHTGDWHQVWVDASGLVLRLRGGPYGSGMRLTGMGNDTTRVHRMTWTPLPDDRIEQVWEIAEHGSTEWSEAFRGFYERLPTAATVDVGSAPCRTPQGRMFDFWPGEWVVQSRQRTGTDEWRSYQGLWRAERALDGCGFLDFTTGAYGPDVMMGVGSRFYDPARDRWILTWVSTENPGRMGVWEGRFETPDRGVFLRTTDTPEGQVMSRIRWLDVALDSARWDYAISRNGGEDWLIVWEMTFARLGNAPEPSPEGAGS